MQQLNEWAETVSAQLLQSSQIVLFELQGGGRVLGLAREAGIVINDRAQTVQVHVLAASPCSLDEDVAAADADGGLPCVRLRCGLPQTGGAVQVARCIHLGAHLAQVYWDSILQEAWAAKLREFHDDSQH